MQEQFSAKRTTREERGIALYRMRGEEIEYVKGETYLVPSVSGKDATTGKFVRKHEVDLHSDRCSCADSRLSGRVCQHVYCARIFAARRITRLRREAAAKGRPASRRGEYVGGGELVAAGLERFGG